MDNSRVYFVTGIDTDTGKSIATGLIALEMLNAGRNVITQKLIQTGCRDLSEDIAIHREIMAMGLTPEDMDGTTCPIMLSYPSSPTLAADIDKVEIDLEVVAASTRKLLSKYEYVLIEGAGGIMAPLTREILTIDYIAEHELPVILVTSPRLGSINHTLLSLEACRARNINVAMVVYNLHMDEDRRITDDTREYLKRYLALHHPNCKFKEIGTVSRQIP